MKPVRAVVFEGGGVDGIEDGDDEDAGAGLGDPEPGVEKHGADLVGTLAQGLVEQTEILAAIGGEQTDDIFQGNDSRLDRHFVQNPEPFPEHAAAGGRKAAHFASEGEVLAGEAGPDDVAVGDGGSADLLDGTEVKMIVAVIGDVTGGLFGADVVRPNGGAGVLGSLGDKAAASKEIDEGWRAGGHEFMRTVFGGVVNLGDRVGVMKKICECQLVGAEPVDAVESLGYQSPQSHKMTDVSSVNHTQNSMSAASGQIAVEMRKGPRACIAAG